MYCKSLARVFHTLICDVTVSLKLFLPPNVQENIHSLGGSSVSTSLHVQSNSPTPLQNDNTYITYRRKEVVEGDGVAPSGTMRQKKRMRMCRVLAGMRDLSDVGMGEDSEDKGCPGSPSLRASTDVQVAYEVVLETMGTLRSIHNLILKEVLGTHEDLVGVYLDRNADLFCEEPPYNVMGDLKRNYWDHYVFIKAYVEEMVLVAQDVLRMDGHGHVF